MDDFVFQVNNVVAVVRVRAADKIARGRSTILGAPSSTEIALANENNILVTGRDAKVTSVDFSMVGPIKSAKPL
jgi:hypothetical protein